MISSVDQMIWLKLLGCDIYLPTNSYNVQFLLRFSLSVTKIRNRLQLFHIQFIYILVIVFICFYDQNSLSLSVWTKRLTNKPTWSLTRRLVRAGECNDDGDSGGGYGGLWEVGGRWCWWGREGWYDNRGDQGPWLDIFMAIILFIITYEALSSVSSCSPLTKLEESGQMVKENVNWATMWNHKRHCQRHMGRPIKIDAPIIWALPK